MFLELRRYNLGKKSKMEGNRFGYPTFQSFQDFSTDYKCYRRLEYDVALNWVQCWQRILRWYEEEKKMGGLGYKLEHVGTAYSELGRSENKLASAAMRLEDFTQDHTKNLSEQCHTTGVEINRKRAREQFSPTPPLSGSESPSSLWPSPSSLSSSQSSQSSPCPPSPKRLCKGLRADERPSISKPAEKCIQRIKERAKKRATEAYKASMKKQTLPTLCPSPHQVQGENDIQMTDTLENSGPPEVIQEAAEAEPEDTLMTDGLDLDNHTPLCPSISYSRPSEHIGAEKPPLSDVQGPIPRRTRSATKFGPALSGGSSRDTGREPPEKAKTLEIAFLNTATADNESPTETPALRRSERIMEKAETSVLLYQPQFNDAQPPQPPEQKQPRKKPTPMKNSRHPRQKKPMIQPNGLEPPQTPKQKKSKILRDVIESTRSSRQKKLEKGARKAVRQGS